MPHSVRVFIYVFHMILTIFIDKQVGLSDGGDMWDGNWMFVCILGIKAGISKALSLQFALYYPDGWQ